MRIGPRKVPRYLFFHLWLVLTLGFLLFICTDGYGQDSTGLADRIINFPTRLFSRTRDKAEALNRQLTKKTEGYLQKLKKDENKLLKEMYKKDSNAARNLFAGDPQQQYSVLVQKMRNDSEALKKPQGGAYLPYADSLQGALAFLSKNPEVLNSTDGVSNKLTGGLTELRQLQEKLQDAGQTQQFIEERKSQIQAYLAQYTQVPGSLKDIYNDYNQQLFYYTQQVQQYKEALNDPDKMMKKALVLLNKLPAFARFMKSNSFLSGLFDVPDDYGSAASIAGLQTRDQVLALVQGAISSGGSNGTAAFGQALQSAQSELQNLKDKLLSLGHGGANMDNPNFKPNNQKTRSFLQRLELGTNIQTAQGSNFFPITTDLGLSLGYRLDDKSDIGVGVSYKIGWGSNISHVKISSQGAGLRSFVDIQMKKSLYLSGGFEYNYQPLMITGQLPIALSNWQKSGLIGLSKVMEVKMRAFKQTKFQLLWDFLSYQQVPRTQPIKFRIGYTF